MENYKIYKSEKENKILIFITEGDIEQDKDFLDDGFTTLKEALHYARLYKAGYQVTYPTSEIQIIIPSNANN